MGIFDLVDPNSRGDYDEALQLAPDIVERETPFHLFLTAEDMNEFRATTKLATYWKYRKELFASRALRPLLDLSGCGALDDNDISVLRMGCVVPLPDDDKGRKVICFDDLRCDCVSESVQMHCWFYLLAAISEQSSIKPDQELVIILIRDNNRQFDYGRFFIMINDAIPVKVRSIHCCYLQSEPDFHSNYGSYLATFLRQIFKKTDDSFVSIHVRVENQDLCHQLQEHGLQRKHLPTTLGGSWLYLSFQADIDRQSQMQKSSQQSKESKTAEKRMSDERRIKKRKTDVAYARKRRRNDKLLETHLKQQCLVLAQNHDKLRQENASLLQAVEAAKHIISVVDASKVAALLPSTVPRQPQTIINRGDLLPLPASVSTSVNLSQYLTTSSTGMNPNWNNNLRDMLAEHQRNQLNTSILLAQHYQQSQNSNTNEKLQQLYAEVYLSNLTSNKFGQNTTTATNAGNLIQNQVVAAAMSHRQLQNSIGDAHHLQQQQQLLRLMGQSSSTPIGSALTNVLESLRNLPTQPNVLPPPVHHPATTMTTALLPLPSSQEESTSQCPSRSSVPNAPPPPQTFLSTNTEPRLSPEDN